jgi:hypothetical protein
MPLNKIIPDPVFLRTAGAKCNDATLDFEYALHI